MLETLSCAKPLVTSDIPEFKLWFRGMPIAYYRDESELEKLVLEALRLNDAMKAELVKASEEVRARFSWDALAAKYENLLETLCY